VAIALGALPRIRSYREALSKLPDFDLARFDKLEAYTSAVNYAHRLYMIASQPPDDLKSLQEEAAQLREVLFKDASAVVARGLVPADALDDLKGTNGYKNTANDLQILVGALQENWAKVQGRCGTTAEELAYADKLVIHLLRTFGARENGPAGVAQATSARQRAFTLFVTAYDDARRALAYLRRQVGDADLVAPSIFSARYGKKKEDAPTEAAAAAEREAEPSGATASTPLAPTITNASVQAASASATNGPF